jgi:hypothetical protein
MVGDESFVETLTMKKRNQIIGVQAACDGDSLDPTSWRRYGLEELIVAASPDSPACGVRVFAAPDSTVRTTRSMDGKGIAFLWGEPVHADLRLSEIPAWALRAFAAGQYQKFRELSGCFVIIIDEPESGRVSFVTDILGIRPLFVGRHRGHLVFGSDVWALYAHGLTQGAVDYDALSTWIAYLYNCTEGSLFSGLRRLPAGSVISFQGGRSSTVPYVTFVPKSDVTTTAQVADDLHEIMSASIRSIARDRNEVALALSGGFDSRYLLALTSASKKMRIESIAVGAPAAEVRTARQVTEALGVPLDVIDVPGSIWDMYDDPYHFTPDGFPITKNIVYLVAQERPRVPIMNGFLGDSLIRGSHDKIGGAFETECNDLVGSLERRYRRVNFDIIRAPVAERMRIRAREPIQKIFAKWSGSGKVFSFCDLYLRQRFYISNNFLQHLEMSEAILPFYDWSLLNYKMGHDSTMFGHDLYTRILNERFPGLSSIARASQSSERGTARPRVTRLWSRDLLPRMCRKDCLRYLMKRRCFPLILAGMTGHPRATNYVFTLQRLWLLEDMLSRAGVSVDWERF